MGRPCCMVRGVSRAAIGFSDHSGWAVMAVVAGDSRQPQFVLRKRIVLCPPELPRQAYHAVAEEGAPKTIVAEVVAQATAFATGAIEGIRNEVSKTVGAAGVAMGRTQIPRDIDKILASHALLHAAEGELYRDVLSEAAANSGLRVVRFLNKEVRSEAAAALGWSLEALEARLGEIGKAAGAPWTRDEKDATAAAMLAFAVTAS